MEDWGPALTDEDLRQMGLLQSDAHEAPAGSNAEEFPDIVDLFRHYDALYFQNKVATFTTVEWSGPQMTRCGGVCMYMPNGGGCRIRLSAPLLKFRPVKDLKMVMIHAYMCLEGIRDSDDHGPKFCAKMNEINSSTVPDYHRPPGGYNITVYHTMHDEVNHYLVHWWECQKCKDTIKRSKNRRPQPADCSRRMGYGDECKDPRCHYHQHVRDCGGAYIKTKGPDLDAAAAAKGGQNGGAGAATAAGRGRAGSQGRGRGAGSRGTGGGRGGASGGRLIESYLVPRTSPGHVGKAKQPEPAYNEAVVEVDDGGDDAIIPLGLASLPPSSIPGKAAGGRSKTSNKAPASVPALAGPEAGKADAVLREEEEQSPAKRQKLQGQAAYRNPGNLQGPPTVARAQESRDGLTACTEQAKEPACAAVQQVLSKTQPKQDQVQQQEDQQPDKPPSMQQHGPGPGAHLRDLCAQAALRRAGGQQQHSLQAPLLTEQHVANAMQPVQRPLPNVKLQGSLQRHAGPPETRVKSAPVEVIIIDSQDS